MNWREDMPVSLEVLVLLALVANLGAYFLSGGSLWPSMIPLGLVAVMLLPMSILNAIARKSPGAITLSILVPVVVVGPALLISLLLHVPR